MIAGMPSQLWVAFLIEALLVGSTLFLLLQPEGLFRSRSDRMRYITRGFGMAFLCLTFCWSVVFGCVLAFQQFSVRI